MPRSLMVALLLALAIPAVAGPRCLTYDERSLGRLQTVCADGTRAVHTYNRTLGRWESTVIPPPSDRREQGRLPPKAPRR